MDMDNLWNEGIDTDELTKAASDLLLPVGTYTSRPPFLLSFNEEEDKFSGRPAGTVANLYGPIELVADERFVQVSKLKNPKSTVKVGDVVARGNIGLRLSFVRVNSKDQEGNDTGKPDRQYKLWMNAVGAYKIAYGGQEPPTKMDVIHFIRDYPVRVRVGQYNVQQFDKDGNPTGREPNGDPGNNVFAISAVKD